MIQINLDHYTIAIKQLFRRGVNLINVIIFFSSQHRLGTSFKGNVRFMFLCNPQKSLVNVCLMKILKSTVTKKVIVCFYNLGEENF